ncbi:MAG: DUF2148 domain-containing protein [Desulfuromonadales bacterium]|nr:DUF2148 domain-containing protein [Desulfuromonadales bacterium]MDW7758872.1 DUF2148 domain-containing protein [Desulfuromonadales bacterium]
MLMMNKEAEEKGILEAARMICIAARTAPKGRGKDLLVSAILTGEEKDALQRKMVEIAERDSISFFARDAGNLEQSPVLVLLGTRKEAMGLPHCGFCGFADCATMVKAGGTCSFNSGDLGIAVGSAVSRAADMRIDNRIMYSAGKAAVEMKLLGPEVAIAYGIPLSVSGKSPFFDRK